MSEADETDLARAMIRLYGRKAEKVASDHAAAFADKGNTEGYKKWQRVRQIVSRLEPKRADSKSTTH